MTKLTRLMIPLLAVLLAGGASAALDESIAVSATATGAYVRPVDAAGALRPESYVFAEGRFFNGGTVDRGLGRAKFTDIARTLAGSLAKRNYFPTKDAAAADLVIVVHWGATLVYEDPREGYALESAQAASAALRASQDATGFGDPTDLNFELSALAAAREETQESINRNAILLGYARALERERRELQPTNAEITMSNELNEERYFVILMAYDNRARRQDVKARPLWITRLSVRSPGNNFAEALPALARVGADVFGRQVDDLVRVKTPIRQGTVKLGELEVLGPGDEKAPPPAKDR